MSRSLRISRSRIATFACSKSPSLTQVPANPVAEITRPKPFSARIRSKRSPQCAHIIVPAASFLAISRLQRRAQGRFRCPGSLARLLRGSAKIRAPNQRRPAPTRIESLAPPSSSIISTHPSSPPLPPVFRWPRPGPSSCDSCSSARLPLSLSRPTRPYFVSLAPARCFDEFSLLPFPFLSPPQPHWTQFPSRHQKENSPRPLSSILVCLRLVLFAPASLPPPTTSTHVPLSSRRVPCNSRVRQHLVLVSIRSSRPHFHLKDNVSPPSPSRLLNWFAPVRSDEAVASGRREARSAKRSNADCQDQRSRVVKHPSFPHGARNKT